MVTFFSAPERYRIWMVWLKIIIARLLGNQKLHFIGLNFAVCISGDLLFGYLESLIGA